MNDLIRVDDRGSVTLFHKSKLKVIKAAAGRVVHKGFGGYYFFEKSPHTK